LFIAVGWELKFYPKSNVTTSLGLFTEEFLLLDLEPSEFFYFLDEELE
jgi:hypothetical protein